MGDRAGLLSSAAHRPHAPVAQRIREAPAKMNTLQRLRPLMGTLVAIEATAASYRTSLRAIEAAYAAMSVAAARWHPHGEESDLDRIRIASPGTRVRVHPQTLWLLAFAHQLHSMTEGIFDPCLPECCGRLGDIECDEQFVECRRPVAPDFGGFAKGYAIDCAIKALLAQGCRSGVVNAGGDLRRFGPDLQPVLLRHPAGHFTAIELGESALAVSDADSTRHPSEHRGYYVRQATVLSPNASEPERDKLSDPLPRFVAVKADRALVADALTKCVMLCPLATTERVLRHFGAERAA